jgi:hypothetical protein
VRLIGFVCVLAGCGVVDSITGGGEPAVNGPLIPGMKVAAREGHRLIDFGSQQGRPPAPVEGITRSQCSELTDGGAIDDYGVSGSIACGETLIGHTRGGASAFDTRFYEHHFCTPATTQHDGGDERVYRLHVPEGRLRPWVTLDTPCADLDLAVIKWSETRMPTVSSIVQDCEMFPKDGSRREVIDVTSDRESDWLIVVEGKGDEEGAFAITVQCVPW